MNCSDCKYYLPVDVFKGLCKLDKIKRIRPELESCENFQKIAKCKFCRNYTRITDFTGKCMNKAEAYQEMIAITCDNFSEFK
ncbi:MAG: 4-hydroxyphenylacetate decarboxylase small subunit [Bacteroidales bacterium]|nr:4-hydroxyphenylacetate decarboxylase small subunit [Bacteroidales bacterium]